MRNPSNSTRAIRFFFRNRPSPTRRCAALTRPGNSSIADSSWIPRVRCSWSKKAATYQADGELEKATVLLARVPVDGTDPLYLNARIRHWTLLHQYDTAINVLRGLLAAPQDIPVSTISNYRAALGIVEALAGQIEAAQADLSRAYAELSAERTRGDQRNGVAGDLILVAGFLQNRESVDRRAMEIQEQIRNDTFAGPSLTAAVAAARAQVGETDAAIASLQHLLEIPRRNFAHSGPPPARPALGSVAFRPAL